MKPKGIACIFGLACLCLVESLHAEEAIPPADAMQIARETGFRMKAAGFDRAESLGFVSDFLQQKYLVVADKITISNRDAEIDDAESQRKYLSVAPALRVTTVAAHEHCHAYLRKGRQHLPRSVAVAAEACAVIPDSSHGRTFDEAFCDLAAINVIGEPARVVLEALRTEEMGDGIERYQAYSPRVFELALAANDTKVADLVTRTANAMASACRHPEIAAFEGQLEGWYAQTLTKTLALNLSVSEEAIQPVEFPNIQQWRNQDANHFKRLRDGIDDSAIIGFVKVYGACRKQLAQHFLPVPTYAERTMERCSLARPEYDEVHCALAAAYVTGRVMGPSLREILDFRQLTDQMFGRQSLASHVLQDEHDYDVTDQLTSISDITQDFALRTEFACGAKPEELSTVRQRSGIN